MEVIDPRTLVPLDIDTIVASVEKTRRRWSSTRRSRTAGAGAEIAAQMQERAFFASTRRSGGSAAPTPRSRRTPSLEQACIPSTDEIVTAALALAAV